MELFTLDWTLSRKLRIPAISRLQKVHNVDVALQVLKDKGVDLKDEHGEWALFLDDKYVAIPNETVDNLKKKALWICLYFLEGANIDSRDIVDGHREKTLNLLWKIIFAFQVSARAVYHIAQH